MKKIFFIICVFFFIIPQPIEALTSVQRNSLLQQIEILQSEIRLLRSLLRNMQLEQEITATSYLVINITDNSVVLGKNVNQIHSIASLTKLMNAIIAKEYIKMNELIVLTEEMLLPFGHSPALYLGLRITAQNLLKASIIQSTNDSAESLANFLRKNKFLDLMNQKTKELGMKNTIFYDVHGLSLENQSTTNDLSKLITYVYKEHPDILEITRNNDFWLPDRNGRLLHFRNLNEFYFLENFIGGKTGFLPQAKETFAGIFRVNEKSFAIILLHSDNRQADIFNLLRQLK